MNLYANKAELARCFGITPPTVYDRVRGIEAEMKAGRYNRYAIADNLVSVAVFADYSKYHKRLKDRNLRKSVPDFNMQEALAYLDVVKGVAEPDTVVKQRAVETFREVVYG